MLPLPGASEETTVSRLDRFFGVHPTGKLWRQAVASQSDEPSSIGVEQLVSGLLIAGLPTSHKLDRSIVHAIHHLESSTMARHVLDEPNVGYNCVAVGRQIEAETSLSW